MIVTKFFLFLILPAVQLRLLYSSLAPWQEGRNETPWKAHLSASQQIYKLFCEEDTETIG